jgi:cytochrome c peroxidase
LINRGYGRAFFWDARARTLEEQVLKPIEDPNEMGLPVADAASRVGLTAEDVSRALASYVRSILSGDSRYDRFVNGDRTALSAEQQAGLQIFRGKGNCTACHVGPNFSDETLHNTGVAWRDAGSPTWAPDRASSRRRRCVKSPIPRPTCTTAASQRSKRSSTITTGVAIPIQALMLN